MFLTPSCYGSKGMEKVHEGSAPYPSFLLHLHRSADMMKILPDQNLASLKIFPFALPPAPQDS